VDIVAPSFTFDDMKVTAATMAALSMSLLPEQRHDNQPMLGTLVANVLCNKGEPA